MVYRIVGLDPSLRNWGMVNALYDHEQKTLSVQSLEIIQPDLSRAESSKQNILDMTSANQLYAQTWALIRDADFIIAEIPSGSQSARASLASGICIGVLGSICARNTFIIPVTPTEVKLAGFGSRTATKKQMIEWAVTKHPEADWPRYKSKGELVINEGKAEHMCDALAVIYAGLKKLKL
jgi:Holliday junction resolvasome RuvABC endonuclease subunit